MKLQGWSAACCAIAAAALLSLASAGTAAASNPAFVRAFAKDVGGPGINVCTTSCHAGTSGDGADAFKDGPGNLAVAASGDVYVADTANNRIEQFRRNGTFVRAFGKGVGGPGINVCTTSCHAGTSGAGAGQLNAPYGIAVLGTGDVYVSDRGNNRIDEFTQHGTFVRAFGKDVGGSGVDVCTTSCQAGSSGTGAAHEINQPDGIGIAGAGTGDVYIADYGNDRIDEWRPARATPTLKTRATASATLGRPISDTATLIGGDNPTGRVTFRAYANSSCSGAAAFTSPSIALANRSARSGTFRPTHAGHYYWTASYSGDATNNAVNSVCNADPLETSVVKRKPKCTLKPVSAHVKVVTVTKDGKKKRRHVLKLRAKCDQAAKLELAGTITAKFKAAPGHKAPKPKHFKLGPVSAPCKANKSRVLVVGVPKSALTLLKQGVRESATFTLRATNANGTGRATAAIAKLKL